MCIMVLLKFFYSVPSCSVSINEGQKWPHGSLHCYSKWIIRVVHFTFSRELFGYHWSLNQFIFMKSPNHRINFISWSWHHWHIEQLHEIKYYEIYYAQKFQIILFSEIYKILCTQKFVGFLQVFLSSCSYNVWFGLVFQGPVTYNLIIHSFYIKLILTHSFNIYSIASYILTFIVLQLFYSCVFNYTRCT